VAPAQTDCAPTEGESIVRLPIDTSLLELSVVADAEPRQYERGKPRDGVSAPSDRGCSAVGAVRRGEGRRAVRWGEGRRAGPAATGSLGTIAETRERLGTLVVELVRVGGRLGEAA
jgi:hypothetical protein